MSELLQQALTWVSANPGWSGLLVFAIAFIESLAIIGVIVPGVVILFSIGAMIGAGALGFWAMVAWAVAGAILGDGLSFWLGRRYSDQLTKLWPFSKHPETLQRGVAFFERYGGKSVALGRFFGPVRAIIPLVAGMLAMPPLRFTIANVLSALAWAPIYLLPGVAFGATLDLASEIALQLVILILLVASLLWFLGWLAHRIFNLLTPRAPKLLERVVRLGGANRWLGEISAALSNPKHPEATGLGLLAAILILSSSLLAILMFVAGDAPGTLDRSLQLLLQGLSTPTSDHLMLAISSIASRSIGLVLVLLIWALLKIFKLPIAARHWLIGLGSVWFITYLGEYWLSQNPRLIGIVPDMYVLRASIQFGLAAILFNTAVSVSKRWRLYSAATVLIAAVIIAQLYHSSTLFAISNALIIGLLWTAAVGVAFRSHGYREKTDSRRIVILSLLMLFMLISSALSTRKPYPRPQITTNPVTISATKWWQGEWSRLDTARHDVTRIHDQHFNIQYLGEPDALINALQGSGWQPATPSRGTDWMATLSTSIPLEQFPVFPRSHNGEYDSIRLVKVIAGKRLVLRLWRSPFIVQSELQYIWQGSVSSQQLQRKLGLLLVPETNNNDPFSLQQLMDDVHKTTMTYQSVNNQTIILIRSN